MPVATIKIRGFRCRECGHEWRPRSDKKPKQCPNTTCRTVFWDKQRGETK